MCSCIIFRLIKVTSRRETSWIVINPISSGAQDRLDSTIRSIWRLDSPGYHCLI